jgi:hypothetical protein
MTPEEFQALLDPAVLALIGEHACDDPAEFSLRFHNRGELPVRAVAGQIACRRKASSKLPSLSRHPLLYTKLSLEQSSGERAAGWKAGLMSGGRLIDLTGGLGIDDIFLSRRFGRVVTCERDRVLAGVAEYNRGVLGIGNVETLAGDSGELLAGFPDDSFDWVYADPARREAGGRSIGLEATSPDVVALHGLMLRKARRACIKASPALEFAGLREKLPALTEVVAVSVDGECKELLLLLDRGGDTGVPVRLTAACLDSGGGEFMISAAEGALPGRKVADGVPGWLCEPDAAIIKARLAPALAARFGLRFLNRSVDYLVPERPVEGFPGRCFHVEACLPFKPKTFARELAGLGISAAAVQRRDFPLSPDEIRKRFRLAESSDRYLFFTRDAEGGLICLCCRKASPAPVAPCRSATPGC